MPWSAGLAGTAAAVRAGVVCTSAEENARTTTAPTTSRSTVRRSRGTPAARRRTAWRDTAATARTAASRPTFHSSSWPEVVCSSAPRVATWISACAVPASTSTVTASAAQLDHTGRIASSSLSLARRNRNSVSMTRPPSHTAMLARCAASEMMVSSGALEVAGCPATGQVPTAITATTASPACSGLPPLPARYAGSSSAMTTTTARRTSWALPYVLSNTADRSAVRRDDAVPDEKGTPRHVGPDRDMQVVAGGRDLSLVDALAVRPGDPDLVPYRGHVLGEGDHDLERRVLGDGALDRGGAHEGGVRAGRPGRQGEDAEQAEGEGAEDPGQPHQGVPATRARGTPGDPPAPARLSTHSSPACTTATRCPISCAGPATPRTMSTTEVRPSRIARTIATGTSARARPGRYATNRKPIAT